MMKNDARLLAVTKVNYIKACVTCATHHWGKTAVSSELDSGCWSSSPPRSVPYMSL